MTHIEQAIEEAVEKGGYKNANDYSADELISLLHEYRIFLDPSFWRAIGKTRDWEGVTAKNSRHMGAFEEIPEWLSCWIDFIRHLAQGKTAEEFFASL